MKLFTISFPAFESLLARDVTPEQIKALRALDFVRDEYAGYSPSEQEKYARAKRILAGQLILSHTRITL